MLPLPDKAYRHVENLDSQLTITPFLRTYQRGGCAQVNRHGIPLRLEWPLDDLRFIQKGEDPPAEVSDEL